MSKRVGLLWLWVPMMMGGLVGNAGTGWCQEPLSLHQCVDRALVENPDLKRLAIQYDNQRLQTLIERARFGYYLAASGSRILDEDTNQGAVTVSKEIVGGFDISGTVGSSEIAGEDFGYFSATLSKTILGGGTVLETRNGINRSLVDESIRLNNINLRRREVRFQVKRAFYQILRNYQTLRIQESRLERARRNLENARIREESLIDIARAEVEVPANEAAVIAAERQIESALDALKVIMGLLPQEELAVSEEFEFQVAPLDVTAAIQHACEFHEDFLNTHLELRKLDWDSRIARTRLWPEVDLFSSYDFVSDEGFDLEGDDDVSVGVLLNWEIGQRSDRAAARRARNAIEDQEIGLYELEQDKAAEIRELARRLAESERAIELQEQQLQVTERLVALYRDRWENGEIEILEYIRSQNDLENARVQLVNQKTSYMELLAQYRFAAALE